MVSGKYASLDGRTILTNTVLTNLDEVVFVDCSNGIVDVTLPDTSVSPGKPILLKKIDSTLNPFRLLTQNTQTIDGNIIRAVTDYIELYTSGTNWWCSRNFKNPRWIGQLSIPLTAGTGSFFTVPNGINGFRITNVEIVVTNTITGPVLSSGKLKIGTAGQNYAEVLTTSGVDFSIGLVGTLLGVGGTLRPILAPSSGASQTKLTFTSGANIGYQVTGNLTGGAISVDLYGVLD